MSHNSFGQLFRFTTWGESHGPALGVVVDGCPPGLPISAEVIQRDLDRRRPGQSRFTTQRREEDAVRILSGTFEDERDGVVKTTGTPISLLIAPATPISPTSRNTASATTRARAAPRRAKLRPASPPAQSPASSSPA